MTRRHGKPKIGSAGETLPAPRSTISTVPETMPAKPPSVIIATNAPMMRIGFVKLIGANCTGGASTGAVRFAPQRLQYLRPVLSVPQDGQNILVNSKS